MAVIKTDELVLRPWLDEDAPELFELTRDPEVGSAASMRPYGSVEESLAAIRGVLRAPESWAVEDARTGELLGAAALRGDDASFELSYWIGRPFWGYGYGTQAARELVRHAVQDLGATRVWAACLPDNERSEAVLRACGLTRASSAGGSPATALLGTQKGERREADVRERQAAEVWELLVRRTVFVDADACPVTAEALECAREAGVPLVIAGNSTQNLERHVRRSDPRDAAHARRGFWVDVLDVSVGADSADFAIVERLSPGDVVVTQDIGLASMALGRGAAAVSVRGHVFRRETIDAELLVRHEEKRVRRSGGRTGGPRAFTSADRRRFVASLRRVLAGKA